MSKVVKLSISLFALSIVSIVLIEFSSPAKANNGNAPSGRAGDPKSGGKTCATSGCHSDGPSVTAQPGWVSSDIPTTGYMPETTYTITAKAKGFGYPRRFGFQLSPQNDAGDVLGTLGIITNNTRTKLIGTDDSYITNTNVNNSFLTDSTTWEFNWTSPVSGSGPVTFYAAFNVSNKNTNFFGDTIYTATLLVDQDSQSLITDPPAPIVDPTIPTAINTINTGSTISVYPNPVIDQLTIKSTDNSVSMQLTIIDLTGKIINKTVVQNNQAFDISYLASGYYNLTVETDQTVEQVKIYKH